MINSIDEMYNVLKFLIEESLLDNYLGFEEAELVYGDEMKNTIYRLEIEAKSFLNKQDKLEFWKKSYKEVYPKLDFAADYLTYTNNGGLMPNWKAEFDINIDRYTEFTKLYHLTCDVNKEQLNVYNAKWDSNWNMYYGVGSALKKALIKNKIVLEEEYFLDFLKRWRVVDYKKNELNFILSKIKELENEIITTQNNTTTKTPHIIVGSKTIKDFLNPVFYKKLLSALETKGIINDGLKIVTQDLPRWKEFRAISCVGWLLSENKHFTKKLNQKNLVLVLSNTFNVRLSEGTYSAAKKTFETSLNIKPLEPHLETFKFINSLR